MTFDPAVVTDVASGVGMRVAGGQSHAGMPAVLIQIELVHTFELTAGRS